MIETDNLILGAGISGLATGQHLKEENKEFLIIDKNKDYGGLCRSFNIDGFDFDYFVHLSFTKNELVRKYFDTIPYEAHTPNPFNYYHGTWIKHPAQNNLYPLSDEEKKLVLEGLNERDKYKDVCNDNYENWIRYQFGDYFAEHFTLPYNRKYWTVEAKDMETKWAGGRVYQPSMDEILEGMKTSETPVTYYAKEMRYPDKGGYEEYLNSFANKDRINLGETVEKIYLKNHIVQTDKNTYLYKHLYNSVPIPELIKLLVNDGSTDYRRFMSAAKELHWTSGYIISLGFKGTVPRPDLWDYIYNEDIYVSRYYSPSSMSAGSAPNGCYSVQAEVYTRDGVEHELGSEELLARTIDQLDRIGAIRKNELIVKDIRFSKYCNIIFDHRVYENRDRAVGYLEQNGVIPIGRFGEWKYLWSDQSFLSGYNAVK